MYTVREVEIDNFWHRLDAKCTFNDDVNIIIGRNGTGKTTFMNLLHAALTVDLEELAENDFTTIKIKLVNGSKSRLVRVIKGDSPSFNYRSIDYKISNRRYSLRAIAATDEVRVPIGFRKRMLEEAAEVRGCLSDLISLSSLSVYRLKSSEDYEIKDRAGKRLVSPVDYRLMQLRADITKYQYELSLKAREISSSLQKDVLASILFTEGSTSSGSIPAKFDKDKEYSKLVNAYNRLGANDSSIQRKINNHIVAVDEAFRVFNASSSHEDMKDKHFTAIESFLRTQNIVDMSLRAEEKTLQVYSELTQFTSTLKEFVPDKSFSISSGELKVASAEGDCEEIPISKLSSGEKQLIILLAEALLQRGKHYVYLADEPELSLHIDWQRKILPAIKRLNQNAQIIAATHSPEVASKYMDSIIDMKEVVSGRA
ncbi:ATP-binding protein [Pseudomonas putida]|uniref:AAA family ATPase n=1 Tax=Pseudomonas putida TaxID=303 RepID=UPI002D1EABDB|nr:AAA family ATPase [Pseudomonas putida]MEB3899427.1 ATP-binding protein [Pseudomonas putida]